MLTWVHWTVLGIFLAFLPIIGMAAYRYKKVMGYDD